MFIIEQSDEIWLDRGIHRVHKRDSVSQSIQCVRMKKKKSDTQVAAVLRVTVRPQHEAQTNVLFYSHVGALYFGNSVRRYASA